MRIRLIVDDSSAVLETFKLEERYPGMTYKTISRGIEDTLRGMSYGQCWDCDDWLPAEEMIMFTDRFRCEKCHEKMLEAEKDPEDVAS